MNPLCIAIDSVDEAVVASLVKKTSAHAGMYKVGATTFAALGPTIVRELASSRAVFCDLKLHDIPSQIEGAVGALGALGASFATVHALGGADMVRAAVDAAPEGLAIIAVTVLTSLDGEDLSALGFEGEIHEVVLRLAELALGAGASGLVCSGREIALLRKRFGAASEGGPLLVVPGIRADASPQGDQQRTFGARAAMEAGADVVVVGRPITQAADPEAAARDLLAQLRA